VNFRQAIYSVSRERPNGPLPDSNQVYSEEFLRNAASAPRMRSVNTMDFSFVDAKSGPKPSYYPLAGEG